ncbi:hypothetical protein G647_06974 [Cladophialophora carrionii CBS 160.54]|uniref:Uncharacterized protein n=1 Tax=Cladophialophora carrionii CBS 160.54 TaxID=1279043 RepID=V9D3P1_9EURO|nr:uncharacterized protein G647_06974 [Cladophialophora carrionii CBS 160.54]ETI20632.1 hypothetical protein G647_06974 [Cladophialophora carrionii CBS 160.54]
MAPSPPAVTDGSKSWAPSHLFDNANPETWERVHSHLKAHEFRAAIASAFELPQGDSFTYHATASVNLAQAEAAIRAGRANGLHDWYVEPAEAHTKDQNGRAAAVVAGQPGLRTAGYPPASDIQAYIALFDPTKAAANSLKSLSANAKKGSLRATIAEYLLSKRHLDASMTVPKFKPAATAQAHENPSLDFWAYSCMALEYAGPNAHTALVKTSHHVLPVYMHHFGCVVPSWESLQIISKCAGGRGVLDMGSGNGYWTLMLRRLGVQTVAVDSGQSRWRTTWIADTAVTDGVQYLRRRSGCPDVVLLLVYPIVGGDFTRRVLDAYAGEVVCVAGTQNGNGYTGFKDMMVDEYMSRERPGWRKVAQVPLPSFAGKDDALFVFKKDKVGEANG